MTKKVCFVIMGFGEKTDYRTQRKLDLDKTYRGIIKPAVEDSGMRCIRADDINHSGVIDKPMYEYLQSADLVIADLSTSNENAIFELGVRYALRKFTTIVIAEDQFAISFDINHQLIRKYKHLGSGIDFEEVTAKKAELEKAIKELVFETPKTDSPVYTYLNDLQPPEINKPNTPPSSPILTANSEEHTLPKELFSDLLQTARDAKSDNDFVTAKALFSRLHQMSPENDYINQQWALATYKTDQKSVKALQDAKKIIADHLAPRETNDPETLGLWGAIHKRLWELEKDRASLDTSIWAYQRGYYLKQDYYNGINLAFILNVRAQEQEDADEQITDKILAKRIRREVLDIVDTAEKNNIRENGTPIDVEEAYWIAATRVEALFGLGEISEFEKAKASLSDLASKDWMTDSTSNQLESLQKIL